MCDVNFSPDKRKVLLLEEDKIKNALIAIMERLFPMAIQVTTGLATTATSNVLRSPHFSKDARAVSGMNGSHLE